VTGECFCFGGVFFQQAKTRISNYKRRYACPGVAMQGPCQSSQAARAQSGRKSRAAQPGRKGRAAQSGRKSHAARAGRKTCAVQPGRLGLAGFYLTC